MIHPKRATSRRGARRIADALLATVVDDEGREDTFALGVLATQGRLFREVRDQVVALIRQTDDELSFLPIRFQPAPPGALCSELRLTDLETGEVVKKTMD